MKLACRNDPATCRCPDHAPGLLAYAHDQAAYLQCLNGLSKTDRTTLTVITTEQIPSLEVVCNGTMTCPCRACSRDRIRRPAQNQRQPWEPKRRLAA